jgi:outer membrane biosynthesis protein TonB
MISIVTDCDWWSEDGKVKEANVVGGHPILVDATLVALKEWKYEPAKAETNLTLTFDFRP